MDEWTVVAINRERRLRSLTHCSRCVRWDRKRQQRRARLVSMWSTLNRLMRKGVPSWSQLLTDEIDATVRSLLTSQDLRNNEQEKGGCVDRVRSNAGQRSSKRKKTRVTQPHIPHQQKLKQLTVVVSTQDWSTEPCATRWEIATQISRAQLQPCLHNCCGYDLSRHYICRKTLSDKYANTYCFTATQDISINLWYWLQWQVCQIC